MTASMTAILACHNRRDTTLAALEALFASCASDAIILDVVLVDDGSTDGTAAAVREAFDRVRVIRSDGSLYWAGAMALAETEAEWHNPDYLLWLNDDVRLDRSAIPAMLAVAEAHTCAIVIGPTRDPYSGVLTYSGVRLAWWHPLRAQLVAPNGAPQPCDTFNGNIVLVPREVRRSVGPIDGSFAHGQADFDYGLRARTLGIEIVLAGSTVGTCPRNSVVGTFRDPSLSVSDRWRHILSQKGLSPRSHARYLRRHGGTIWPVYFVAPYLILSVDSARQVVMAALRRGRQDGTRNSGDLETPDSNGHAV